MILDERAHCFLYGGSVVVPSHILLSGSANRETERCSMQAKIKKALLNQLKPGTADVWVWDTVLKGFGL